MSHIKGVGHRNIDATHFIQAIKGQFDDLPILAGFVLGAEALRLAGFVSETLRRPAWAADLYRQAGDIYHTKAQSLEDRKEDVVAMRRAFYSAALLHTRSADAYSSSKQTAAIGLSIYSTALSEVEAIEASSLDKIYDALLENTPGENPSKKALEMADPPGVSLRSYLFTRVRQLNAQIGIPATMEELQREEVAHSSAVVRANLLDGNRAVKIFAMRLLETKRLIAEKHLEVARAALAKNEFDAFKNETGDAAMMFQEVARSEENVFKRGQASYDAAVCYEKMYAEAAKRPDVTGETRAMLLYEVIGNYNEAAKAFEERAFRVEAAESLYREAVAKIELANVLFTNGVRSTGDSMAWVRRETMMTESKQLLASASELFRKSARFYADSDGAKISRKLERAAEAIGRLNPMPNADLRDPLAKQGKVFASRARFLMEEDSAKKPVGMARIRGDLHISEPLSTKDRKEFARLFRRGEKPLDILVKEMGLSRDEAMRIMRDPTTAVGALLGERGLGVLDDISEGTRYKRETMRRRRGGK